MCPLQAVAALLARLPLDPPLAVLAVMAPNAAMVVVEVVRLRSATVALAVMAHFPVVVEVAELLQPMAQHQALVAMARMASSEFGAGSC